MGYSVSYSFLAHDRGQQLYLVMGHRPHVVISDDVIGGINFTHRLCGEVRDLNDEIKNSGIRDIHDAAKLVGSMCYEVV